jgi:hypothetical protein
VQGENMTHIFYFFGGKTYFYSFVNVVPVQEKGPQDTADALLLVAALTETKI